MGEFFNKELKDLHKLPDSKTLEQMRKDYNKAMRDETAIATIASPAVSLTPEEILRAQRQVNMAKARAARGRK